MPSSEQCPLDRWICSDSAWETLKVIPILPLTLLSFFSIPHKADNGDCGVQLLLYYLPTGIEKQYDSLLLNKLLNVILKV